MSELQKMIEIEALKSMSLEQINDVLRNLNSKNRELQQANADKDAQIEELKQQVIELARERDELAAHVERLNTFCKSWSLEDAQSDPDFADTVFDLITKSPTHSLAEHDAKLISEQRKRWAREDVGALRELKRVAFIAGAEWWAQCELDDALYLDENEAATRYVNGEIDND